MHERKLFRFENGSELHLDYVIYVGACDKDGAYNIQLSTGNHVAGIDSINSRVDFLNAWKRSMMVHRKK